MKQLAVAQTLDRGLDCLFALASSNAPLSISELANLVNLPDSTVYRLIRPLEERGLVERAEQGKRVLGPRVLELARPLRGSRLQLREIARHIMQELSQTTRETVNLTVLSGLESLCIHSIESPQGLRVCFDEGRTQPLYVGASAKILLAYQDPDFRETVLRQCHGHKHANGTVVDSDRLRKQLEEICREGFVFSTEEVELGAAGIAAPIWNKDHKLLAGLTAVGPKERFSGDQLPRLTQLVVDGAQQISQRVCALL